MKNYAIFLISILLLGACQSPKNNDATLDISWELIDNLTNFEGQSVWQITITNKLGTTLENKGWSLYFNHILELETRDDATLTVNDVNGDLRIIKPTNDFKPLNNGESYQFNILSSGSVINFTDAPLGFFLVLNTNPENAISCNLTLKPIPTNNLKRIKDEELPVHNAKVSFDENKNNYALNLDQFCPIIPTPVKIQQYDKKITLSKTISLSNDALFENEAQFAINKLAKLFNGEIKKSNNAEANIRIEKTEAALNKEGYLLNIDDNGVLIQANAPQGAFYGIQSFLALIAIDAWEKPTSELVLTQSTITDEPRFEYRGIFMDVARNFQPKANVLKLLDAMAFYKLNKFHFHICDDEGWRVEINGLPELTDFGAYRGYSINESKYLYPSFGSGPNADPNTSHGSGFYTREDFIEILKYATERHIEVIPEIDMPGHARAAIRSMQIRYDKYMALGNEKKAKEYLLSDFDDKSEYTSVQGWTDNVVDVCMESTYHFLAKISDEMVELYKEANAPLTTIHTGGDEVPHGVWTDSPTCNAFLAKNNQYAKSTDLSQYFIERFANILAERNLLAAGWEEIALLHGEEPKPNPAMVGKNLQAFVWNNMWNSGAEDIGYKLANAGYPVVLAHVTNFYFDLAYNKNPEEPGYYWGNFIDTKRAWEYTPFDLSKCAEFDRFGFAIDQEQLKNNMNQLSPKGAENILGIQGLLWSENNLGAERMEYLFFPKMLGLAERAWAQQPAWAKIENLNERHLAKNKAWNEFSNTVGHYELPRLDYMNNGYGYRIPPAGIDTINGTLQANVIFPGLTIRYTLDGSEPDKTATLYTNAITINKQAKFRTFAKNNRSSRSSMIE